MSLGSAIAVQKQHGFGEKSMAWLYVLFFFSGFPALIYQIVWQRALFAIYGINVEAVTVVVSAFMLGLGVGSFAGGYVSKRPQTPLLAVFACAELGISAFGFVSLRLFHKMATLTGGISIPETGVIAFLLVVVPTTLMGATLPLLVAHMVRISGNVGRSVGALYFVNTLGSAAACFVAARITMRYLGMEGSVITAALINAGIGTAVLFVYLRHRGAAVPEATPAQESTRLHLIPFSVGVLVAGCAGFISLAYEILWYRVYSFVSGGQAKSFAYMLGAFLAGIAFGSLLTRRLCGQHGRTDRGSFLRAVAGLVIGANLVGYLLIPVVARAVVHAPYVVTLPLVALAAGLMGATFPLMCHISVKPDHRAGARLSYLYVSNILGSVLGSLLVGFILMDSWGIRQISTALALVGIGLGFTLWISGSSSPAQKRTAMGVTAGIALFIAMASPRLFSLTYERLQYKTAFDPSKAFVASLENRSGVITVDGENVIYGGGIYDGAFSVDLVHDKNNIFRVFAALALHPAPREVLSIGLSSGSWAQILANDPRIQKLTIVEINPGYQSLVARYPAVAPVLSNPKVEIVIDDGRRWLVRNPDRKFDIVVSNTTYNWRAHATNLLSVEFLELIRRHLQPGGIHYYNTTGSDEAQRTGAAVFPHCLRIGSFVAASDSPLSFDGERWRQTLTSYRIEGAPVLDLSRRDDQKRLQELLALPGTMQKPTVKVSMSTMETGDGIRRRTAGKRVITDDNMGTEWFQ